MEGSSDSDHLSCDGESVLVTPCQKQMLLKSDLQPLNMDFPPTSNGENSYVSSVEESCESPLSSWDSEAESDISFVVNCDDGISEGSLEGINLEDKYLEIEQENQFVAVENTDDSLLWEMDNRSYEELHKKFIENEEELRVSNFKLQLSEQEIIKLKVQVENSDGQLHNVHEELKLIEDEVRRQKELSEEEIFKMKIQIEERENQLGNVREKLKLNEEELHKQRELSEEEIFKMKIQIQERENQLGHVREKLKLKEQELHRQKELSEEEISKMKIQIEERENQLGNVREELKLEKEELRTKSAELYTKMRHCVNRVANTEEQLEVAKEQHKISKDEIAILRTELDSKSYQTCELQDQLKVTQTNLAKLECLSGRNRIEMLEHLVRKYEAIRRSHELQVQKLNSEMLDLKAKFSLEKDEIHYDIASLSDMNKQLTSKLEKCETRNHELENKLRQYEAEKLKQEELQATQQMVLQDELSSLREELCQRKHDVEAANKEFDKLMIERDEGNAEIDKLNAEIFSKNDQISTLRRYISMSWE